MNRGETSHLLRTRNIIPPTPHRANRRINQRDNGLPECGLRSRISSTCPTPSPTNHPMRSASASVKHAIERCGTLWLAEKLKMPVEDLMRQANGHASPSKALVKGLAQELDINESYLEKLAQEVREDLR